MVNTDPLKGHAPVDHAFAIDRFKYENEIHYQPCVKVSIFFKKRKDVSYEHFFKHWATVHADLTVSSKIFGAFEIQRYTQHHALPEMQQGLVKMGMKPMDYDGCSTIWFKTWDGFEKFFTHPDHLAGKLGDDCRHFLDTEAGLEFYAGRDVIVFGKAAPGAEDEDGMTEYFQEAK